MMLLQGDQMAWSDKDLVEAFRTFDSENKGYILSAELKYVLSRMDDEAVTKNDIQEMINISKLNVNRKITFNGKNISDKPIEHLF